MNTLLEQERIVAAMADGSKVVKWLDVPNGPIATGQGQFRLGHLARSQSGRNAVQSDGDSDLTQRGAV